MCVDTAKMVYPASGEFLEVQKTKARHVESLFALSEEAGTIGPVPEAVVGGPEPGASCSRAKSVAKAYLFIAWNSRNFLVKRPAGLLRWATGSCSSQGVLWLLRPCLRKSGRDFR